MNIFHKVALEGMKKNRTRTRVTIIGVALSAALFTAVAVFGSSLIQYLIDGTMAKGGNWHVNYVNVDHIFQAKQQINKEVTESFSFGNEGYALLEGAKSKEKPYLFFADFTDETFEKLPITLITGRRPEDPSEVIVPNTVALKAGVRIPIGQTLTVNIGNRVRSDQVLTQHDPYREGEKLQGVEERTYTVVGIYERAAFEEHEAPGYTLITKTNGDLMTSNKSLFITLKNPRKVKSYLSGIGESHAYVLNENLLRFYGVSDNALFNTLLFTVGGILTAIIMIGSIFLIYNAFHISLSERTHQFGILMSVGATEKQLRQSVLFEGLCIGMIGIPIGIVIGIGGVAILLPLVAANFSMIIESEVPLHITFSLIPLALAALASLITILISAYLPARKAAAMPVMACIKQTGEIKIEEKDVKLSKWAQRFYGLEGSLALKNFKRNKRRYRSVVLSLTLSVSLFIAGSTFGETLKAMSKALTVEMDGDLSFYTSEIDKEDFVKLYDELQKVEGIERSTYQLNTVLPCQIEGIPKTFIADYNAEMQTTATGENLEAPMHIQLIEDDIYNDFIKSIGLPKEDYSGQHGKVLTLVLDSKENKALFAGDKMKVKLLAKNKEVVNELEATIVDNYPLDTLPFDEKPKYLLMMVAPLSLYPSVEKMGMPEKWGMTLWSHSPSKTMARLQAELDNKGIECHYTLVNLSMAVDLFRSITFVVDLFTYAFVIMILLIAIANVFNTISTNIQLRRRELAMLRSVGMSERSFSRMLNFECFFYGIRTLCFAVPLSGILSWLIYKGLMLPQEIENYAYHFPFIDMGLSMLGVFGIVFMTMLYTTSKIKKENIIDALRDDIA